MTVRHLAVPAYAVPSAGAIAFRSASNTTYGSTVNTTIPAPTGIVTGDQLIFVWLNGGSSPFAPDAVPSGATQIGTHTQVGVAGFNVRMYVYRKTASGESGSYTFTHTNVVAQGFALCYSGVNTTTPLDVTHTTNTGTATTTTATGLTTVTNGAMIVFLAHDFGSNTTNRTPPTGMTERVDVRPLVYAADEVRATAGATGNRSHTNNNSAPDPWAVFLVALRPA